MLRDVDNQANVWNVHLRNVIRLEVSRGTRSRADQAGRLAFLGGLVGAAGATFIAAVTGDELSPGARPLFIGAGAGLATGAVVGWFFFPRRERWRDVETFGRFGYVPLYQPGQYGVALSFAF